MSADERMELQYQRAAEYGAKTLVDLAAVLDRESEPAFLVFTSDHGENLPSDRNGKRYLTGAPGKLDSRVPALVLWNKAFAMTGRASELKLLVGDQIAHRDVAQAWLTLAGQPGEHAPTPVPRTWAAPPMGSVPCSTLAR